MSFPMDFLSQLLGGGKATDPMGAAMPYLQQIPDMLKKYLEPYIQSGKEAGAGFPELYQQMAMQPGQYLENIMAGYQPSRGYEVSRDEALKAASNTAAAGGMRGTPLDQQQQADMVSKLQSQDMQQYLQNILGITGMGTSGATNLYETGFEAARGLSGDLSNLLGTEAGLGFQAEREKQQRRQDLINSLLGMAGKGAGFAAGKFF